VVRRLIEFIKDLALHSAVSFVSLFFVSPDCQVHYDRAVCTHVLTGRFYKFISKFVGAKCGCSSVQQVGVAVKW